MPEGLVTEFQKNKREVVRVSLTTYHGAELVDVRAYYQDGTEWKPGKGLALRRDLLPQLKRAIAAAEKAVRTGQLAPSEPTDDAGSE